MGCLQLKTAPKNSIHQQRCRRMNLSDLCAAVSRPQFAKTSGRLLLYIRQRLQPSLATPGDFEQIVADWRMTVPSSIKPNRFARSRSGFGLHFKRPDPSVNPIARASARFQRRSGGSVVSCLCCKDDTMSLAMLRMRAHKVEDSICGKEIFR